VLEHASGVRAEPLDVNILRKSIFKEGGIPDGFEDPSDMPRSLKIDTP
jgi:hypothetical protein